MNTRLPIIDQLINARDDRARIDVLLQCPDAVVLKYEVIFLNAFRHFEPGEYFVLLRTNAMRAVRSEAGALPQKLAAELEAMRAALAKYAASADAWPAEDPTAI